MQAAHGSQHHYWYHSGSILGAFWEHSGRICWDLDFQSFDVLENSMQISQTGKFWKIEKRVCFKHFVFFTLACAKHGHGTLQPPMHDVKDQAMPEILHSVWPMGGCSALDTHSVFLISLSLSPPFSLTFDWLGAAGNTNTTHCSLGHLQASVPRTSGCLQTKISQQNLEKFKVLLIDAYPVACLMQFSMHGVDKQGPGEQNTNDVVHQN